MSTGTRKLSASDSGTSDTLALVSITAIVDLRLRHTGAVGKTADLRSVLDTTSLSCFRLG